MADNSVMGSTDTIATDDLGGSVKVQRVKAGFGVDGSYADVTAIAGLPTVGTQPVISTTNWTSATGVNTANTITITGLSTVTVGLHLTTTMTAGVLTFEVSPDNTNWFPLIINRIDSYVAEASYNLVFANGDRGWSASVDAWNYFRVRLSTVISGSGTASVFVAASSEAIEPNVTVGQSVAASLQATATVRQNQFWFETNVPGVAAAVYAAGDQFGTLISITNAAQVTGGGGFITSVIVYDDDDLQTGMDVLFYNDTLTLAADNAVYAISDADGRKGLWIAQIPYLVDTGAQRFGQIVGVSIPYFCTATTLYAAIRTQSAVTPTTTGVRLRVGLTRD